MLRIKYLYDRSILLYVMYISTMLIDSWLDKLFYNSLFEESHVCFTFVETYCRLRLLY